jgi:hypothetical protein
MNFILFLSLNVTHHTPELFGVSVKWRSWEVQWGNLAKCDTIGLSLAIPYTACDIL